MARELAIAFYLFVFQVFFGIFKLFPQKEKTTFVASFGDNILYTLNELERQTNNQIVILKSPQCKINFGSNILILDFETTNLVDWILSVYHLATSQKVIVDNYYGFLSVTEFKPNVQCIQLWHAAGALKQFALKDPSIKDRSSLAKNRLRKVYHRFNYVVVGSERMASIFRQSFDISDDKILRTGIPRTDFFYDSEAKKEAEKTLLEEFTAIDGRKVILYAPTYRDDELNISDLHLNIGKMYQSFKDEFVIMLRLHPAVNGEFQNKYPSFVINVSSYYNISHLLVASDILITDYSSIPFEYSLLNKPIIFYAYDLDRFIRTRGLWNNFEANVPGPVVYTTSELIQTVKSDKFDMESVKQFAALWNQYSKGNSSEKLISRIYFDAKINEEVRQYKLHN